MLEDLAGNHMILKIFKILLEFQRSHMGFTDPLMGRIVQKIVTLLRRKVYSHYLTDTILIMLMLT